jgi:type IV conjugative transfer system protein TraL
MDKYTIPKYLNERYQIASFTLDEIVAMIILVIASLVLSGGPMIGIIAGVLIVGALKKIKGEEGHNQLLRLVYWYLPPIIRFRSTPPSHIREILG